MIGIPRPVALSIGLRAGAGGRGRLGLVALLLLAACGPPDHPVSLPEPLPDAATALLGPDTVRVVRPAPGLLYRYIWSPLGPWAIHLLEVDLTGCRVGFSLVRAPGDPGSGRSTAPVTKLFGDAPPGAVAAVNGDFFTAEGTPRGPEVSGAGARVPGPRPIFAWDPARGPFIGAPVLVDDSTVFVKWGRGPPESSGPGTVVVGGFPLLLRESVPVGGLEVQERPGFAGVRHPRTAVGRSDTGRRVWIVVVDGRQGSYSVGMTLPEVANLLRALGASEAVNLDGGGSSVMVFGGRVVSRPSDAEGERSVVNALVVRSTPDLCAGTTEQAPSADWPAAPSTSGPGEG